MQIERTENFIANGLVSHNTRWNDDDLTGRIQQLAKETGEDWAFVSFPALCEDETNPLEQRLGRKNGESLWPERFSEPALQMIKSRSAYWWNGLYQQRPSPLEGNLVKSAWFRYFSVQERDGKEMYDLFTPEGVKHVFASDCRKFFTIDLAASIKTMADYTVVSVWAMHIKTMELLWLDAVAIRLEGPDQLPLIKKMNSQWNPVLIGCEATAYQLTMVQDLMREGLPTFKLKSDKDKVSRFIPAGTYYENGMVYHRHLAPWLADAEDQLLHFPNAKHDDYVDTVSYAYQMLPIMGGGGEIDITGA